MVDFVLRAPWCVVYHIGRAREAPAMAEVFLHELETLPLAADFSQPTDDGAARARVHKDTELVVRFMTSNFLR